MKYKIFAASILAASLIFTGAALADDGTRVELGFGAQWGNPHASFAGESGDIDTDTGWALSVAGWKDNVFVPTLSLGLQFLHLDNSDFDKPLSDAFAGATGTAKLEPNIDALMVNAAYRPDFSALHPFVGVGAGLARAHVKASASGTVTVNGQTFLVAGSDSDSDVSPAGQLFAGVDYDLTQKVYVGATLTYFAVDNDLFGADVEFRNWIAMAHIGTRF